MGRLRWGRYFILEGMIEGVYAWLDENVPADSAVFFSGMCPMRRRPILSAVFERAEDLARFEAEFLANLRDEHSLIHANRRDPTFDWPAIEERRVQPERRKCLTRRGPGRDGGRRTIDQRLGNSEPIRPRA